ncbi:MAG: RNA polymerase sigma-70 factor [Odoribacter sp.]
MAQVTLSKFRVLFEELYPEMVKNAMYYVHDTDIAKDITQEAFVKLWEKCQQLPNINNLKGYLQYTIKHNSLNYLEHLQVVDKYQQEYFQELQEEEEAPSELIAQVLCSLEKLPSKRRQVLEMNINESMSYQEIADQLGISINTVKDHIKKAYRFLRQDIHSDISSQILFLAFSIRNKR